MGWIFDNGSQKRPRGSNGFSKYRKKACIQLETVQIACFGGWKLKRKRVLALASSWMPCYMPQREERKHAITNGSRTSSNASWIQERGSSVSEASRRSSSLSSVSRFSKVHSPGWRSDTSSNCKKDVSSGTTNVSKEGDRPVAAKTFSYRELAAATRNFRPECLVGEGGFGRVYKGRLESTGQIVAVKQLDMNGLQGKREFLVEVLMLSVLHHPNLVNLIGYCADGDQRLLVYEFMPLGSLENHLHDLAPGKDPLDWSTRMKIAAGAAKGLEYLHEKANPPVIYRDLKSSNLLLCEGFHPKLSDFGLAKVGPVGDKTHVSTRVMGTYGYCAPEYAMTGQLTLKSDVYSFGVVLLELITGRKAVDKRQATGEHNLVAWARPLFRDRRSFLHIVDPLLQDRFPIRGLFQALAVAAMCVQEQPDKRPFIGDVVTALSYLASQSYNPGFYPISRRVSLHLDTSEEGERKKRENEEM